MMRLNVLRLGLLRPTSILFAALMVCALPRAGSGQDVTYTTVTDVEYGGGLGILMNFVPGGDQSTVETTYIKGGLVRTDEESSSTVVDYVNGLITMEDHESQTYYTLTFEQMFAAMGKMRQIAADGAQGTVDSEENLEDVDFDFKLSTDGSGQRAQVAGYDARQTVLTLEVEAEATENDGTIALGEMVMIMDTWMSEDFPGHAAMERAYEQHGEEMQENFAELATSASGMEAAFVHDPRLRAAIERNREELDELDGAAVKSVGYFVIVPNGAKLDRDAVLATEGKPISEGLGSVLGRAAADGAASAVRGRLGGLLGRRGGDDKPKEEETPDPQPSLIARITAIVTDAQETTLDAAHFQPHEGYGEQMPQFFRDVIAEMEPSS